MKVAFEFFGQLADLAGIKMQEWEVCSEETLGELVAVLAKTHGEDFQKIILNEREGLRPSVLIVVNEEVAEPTVPVLSLSGKTVRLIPFIAGG